jgi:uncharacterized membrane protein
MPTLLENASRIGRRIGIDDEKGYVVAIILALIVMGSIVGGYYVVFNPKPAPFNSLFLLDQNQKTVDYPQNVTAGSTVTVYANVVNHMNSRQNYRVQVKQAQNPLDFPVNAQPTNTYDFNLADGAQWQNPVSLSFNQPGTYSVVFELYLQESSGYQFTHSFCVLNVQVTG